MWLITTRASLPSWMRWTRKAYQNSSSADSLDPLPTPSFCQGTNDLYNAACLYLFRGSSFFSPFAAGKSIMLLVALGKGMKLTPT